MNGRKLTVVTAMLASAVALAAGVAAGSASTSTSPYKLAGTFGKPGTGNGQFSGAKGIAVAANGNVYIADSNNNRVEVFSKTGAFRSKWGTIGSANGQFTGAQDVAVGPDGSVWVADDGNARAQGFSASGGWKSIVTIESESARAVAVDSAGDV
jgi:streptogramin lyase